MEEPHARTGAIGGDIEKNESRSAGVQQGIVFHTAHSQVTEQPSMKPFEWHPASCVSYSSEWNGLYLEAWRDGRWVVFKGPGRAALVFWNDQTLGTDLIDAQKRAQGAAMIIHQKAQQNQKS